MQPPSSFRIIFTLAGSIRVHAARRGRPLRWLSDLPRILLKDGSPFPVRPPVGRSAHPHAPQPVPPPQAPLRIPQPDPHQRPAGIIHRLRPTVPVGPPIHPQPGRGVAPHNLHQAESGRRPRRVRCQLSSPTSERRSVSQAAAADHRECKGADDQVQAASPSLPQRHRPNLTVKGCQRKETRSERDANAVLRPLVTGDTGAGRRCGRAHDQDIRGVPPGCRPTWRGRGKARRGATPAKR